MLYELLIYTSTFFNIIFIQLQSKKSFFLLCHSHSSTKELIHISALSKLRESAEISAVRYTNLNSIVVKIKIASHIASIALYLLASAIKLSNNLLAYINSLIFLKSQNCNIILKLESFRDTKSFSKNERKCLNSKIISINVQWKYCD